ncbi:MAG TPA: glycosyltransferase [Nevskiaceae bacterium]|nr:glycosyltransferase [Nevskiaceae bacterium]
MRISGLSLIRDGFRLGYPFLEAIRSILPLVDEMVVVVAASTDGTREAIEAIGDPKIRIIDSIWPEQIRPKACVLTQQTNIGLLQCTGDWVVYVQACEVFHEDDLPRLRAQMAEHLHNDEVEGLLIERLVFYGDHQHVNRLYPERFKYVVRAIKPWTGALSVDTAMGFAIFDAYGKIGREVRAIDSGVNQFRYSQAIAPRAMEYKLRTAPHTLIEGATFSGEHYYTRVPKSFIARYPGTPPAVMKAFTEAHPFRLDPDSPLWRTRPTRKERWRLIETALYRRLGIPRWRHGRYTLIGDWVRKDRGWEQASLADGPG